MKIAVIYSDYYKEITDGMLAGLYEASKDDDVTFEEFKVMGSFEVPYMVQKVSNMSDYDAFIALGCIIEGETYHNQLIADSVAKGLMDLSLKLEKPVGLGILSVKSYDQAVKRSTGDTNKGAEVYFAIKSVLAS